MRKKQWHIILLAGSLFVLFNLIFYETVIMPFSNEKKQMENHNEQLAADIGRLKNTGIIPGNNSRREIINADIMIPREPYVPVIYEYIAQAADETGVNLQEVCFPAPKNPDSVPCQGNCNLCVTGSYGSLTGLIEMIEAYPRCLIIKDIKLSKYENKMEKSKLQNADENSMEEDGPEASGWPDLPEGGGRGNVVLLYRAELLMSYFYMPEPMTGEMIGGGQADDGVSSVFDPGQN